MDRVERPEHRGLQSRRDLEDGDIHGKECNSVEDEPGTVGEVPPGRDPSDVGLGSVPFSVDM